MTIEEAKKQLQIDLASLVDDFIQTLEEGEDKQEFINMKALLCQSVDDLIK